MKVDQERPACGLESVAEPTRRQHNPSSSFRDLTPSAGNIDRRRQTIHETRINRF